MIWDDGLSQVSTAQLCRSKLQCPNDTATYFHSMNLADFLICSMPYCAPGKQG